MQKIQNKDLKALHKAFRNTYSYIEKLKFFDTHFGITPFQFPFFQSEIDHLFEGENGKLLFELFEIERYKKAGKLDSYYQKSFSYFGKDYIFNITPTNSLRELYNDFILKKFMNNDDNFNAKIDALKLIHTEDREQLNTLFNNEILNIKKLENHVVDFQQKATIKNQFFNVFHNGFSDYRNGAIKSFPHKKKYIELYLYAQGILHAKYFEEIKKCFPNLMII